MTDKKENHGEEIFRKKMEEMEIQAETIRKIYEVLDEEPNNVSKNLDLAMWLFEQEAYDDMWQPLEKILEIDPKNKEALSLKSRLKKIKKTRTVSETVSPTVSEAVSAAIFDGDLSGMIALEKKEKAKRKPKRKSRKIKLR